jgi:Mn2+/Fe2+ NRAMP family transporter
MANADREQAPDFRMHLREFFAKLLSLPTLVALVVVLSMICVFVLATRADSGAAQGIWTVEYARGLITLLFSVGTIVIALILTLSAIFLTGTDVKERFDRAKEILTILIGIFGTIVGFYFGSLSANPNGQTDAAKAKASAIPASEGAAATVPANPIAAPGPG